MIGPLGEPLGSGGWSEEEMEEFRVYVRERMRERAALVWGELLIAPEWVVEDGDPKVLRRFAG